MCLHLVIKNLEMLLKLLTIFVNFYYSQNFLQTFRIVFLQNGPYNINILVMFFELRAFLKFDQYGWFKK